MTTAQRVELILLIGVGGGLGSILRYLISGWANQLSSGWFNHLALGTFPTGTLTVNVVGCFAIGVLNVALLHWAVPPMFRIAILVGILGGFTTFSSFGFETLSLMNDGQWALFAANLLLNNGLGLFAAWLGYRLTQHYLGV